MSYKWDKCDRESQMRKWRLTMTLLAAASAGGVSAAGVSRAPFGTADGHAVEAITLSNAAGTQAEIITYGAALESLKLADRHGHFDDVIVSPAKL